MPGSAHVIKLPSRACAALKAQIPAEPHGMRRRFAWKPIGGLLDLAGEESRGGS